MPAGFPSPAENYLENPLDLYEYLIENKAATLLMRVKGESMGKAGILNGHVLVVDRAEAKGGIALADVVQEIKVFRLGKLLGSTH